MCNENCIILNVFYLFYSPFTIIKSEYFFTFFYNLSECNKLVYMKECKFLQNYQIQFLVFFPKKFFKVFSKINISLAFVVVDIYFFILTKIVVQINTNLYSFFGFSDE